MIVYSYRYSMHILSIRRLPTKSDINNWFSVTSYDKYSTILIFLYHKARDRKPLTVVRVYMTKYDYIKIIVKISFQNT